MNRLFSLIILLFFPALTFAQSSMNFTPPPSDSSMFFLSSLFGMVDGVLSDSGGHQILGEMFKIFNSAVLAIGGLVLMYTLLVSTINTAHKGQMMGEKWNSVWVPVRATLGLALLVPKASGYCLIQIIVMWVVVQGVGAADKVWNAALDYLNRGGLIIQTQVNPLKVIQGSDQALFQGASTMLEGQVCMLGLQKVLQQKRSQYLAAKMPTDDDNSDSTQSHSLCGPDGPASLKDFCKTTIPDFIQSVDFVAIQSAATPQVPPTTNPPIRDLTKPVQTFEAPMPNFPMGTAYHGLNGICGTIKWNAMAQDDLNSMGEILPTDQQQVVSQSRAIALQQMYTSLSSLAEMMINNDPAFMTNPPSKPYSSVANNQFGIPYNSGGTPCSTTPSDKAGCIAWGPESAGSAPLFSGAEYLNAIQSYTGVMMPTNRLIADSKDKKTAQLKRAFIKKAENTGWITAGSYFIDLARINSSNVNEADLADKNTGLGDSSIDLTKFNDLITNGSCENVQAQYSLICNWLQIKNRDDAYPIQKMMNLITGTGSFKAEKPTNSPFSTQTFADGKKSSTVYGFISNSSQMSLPTAPGQTPPQFALKINMDTKPSVVEIEDIDYSCKWWYAFCIDSIMVNVGYNLIFKFIYNAFLKVLLGFAKMVLMTFLQIPLQGMAQIFIHGVSFIQQPSVNPVIALANMGVNYINYSMDLWITLTTLSVSLFALLPMLMMIMPLLLAWIGIMLGIGFITAYYIPFLPYMIFTFASLAWLMAVIEAMVAAPIVALGVTHPEGEGAFGKGEQAIMLLMNVFLRPAMMIIGYISAIALSYVGVWLINSGFANVVSFIQGDLHRSDFSGGVYLPGGDNAVSKWINKTFDDGSGLNDSGATTDFNNAVTDAQKWAAAQSNMGNDPDFKTSGSPNRNVVDAATAGKIDTNLGYTGWAGIYGFFFSVLIYTSMYMTVVQKSFTLIVALPDKVLRWIAGGQAETTGSEAVQWAEEGKQKITEAGEKTGKAGAELQSQMGKKVQEQGSKLKGKPSDVSLK